MRRVRERKADSRPKRQHYVPILHLQHFTGSSPKNMIWTFDNVAETWRPSTVDNTAVQGNFYSIETDSDHNDDLERLLGDIESDAAPAYEMLLNGDIPVGQARANFSMFLATLHLRTPAMINAMAQMQGEMAIITTEMGLLRSREDYDATVATMERDDGTKIDLSYDEMKAFVTDKSRYELAVMQQSGIGAIGAADKIAPLLYHREWHVCRAMQGQLVTSDNPVVRFVPPDGSYGAYGDGGFMNRAAEITFPLSPTKLLLIAGFDESGTRGEVKALGLDGVRVANELRAHAAEKYVYAATRDDDVGALAVKHRDSKQRMTVGRPMGGDPPNVKIVRRLRNKSPKGR